MIKKEKIAIELTKEKLEKFKVRYSDTNDKATYTNKFILYHGNNFIEVILDEDLLNKKIKILLENEVILNDILTNTDIIIPVEKRIDIEEIAKHIKIETTT